MAFFSLVSTAAGLGGGAIYSTFLMFIDKFDSTQAFPISNFIILLCSLTTFYVGVKDKYEHPEHKFVDYNIVIIFIPTLLLGTKFGTILNKISPNLFLNILLILSLAFSSYKTYLK